MNLDNILIVKGYYSDLSKVETEVIKLRKKMKTSSLYDVATYKYIKQLEIQPMIQSHDQYILTLSFLYKNDSIKQFIDQFQAFNVEWFHLCANAKQEIWIVNELDAIKTHRLIPTFAINEILLDYMNYKESSIILDSFETIKYDRNAHMVVVDNKKQNHDELLNLLFEKTIKGKIVFDLLEQFVMSYYHQCINSYESLYSSNNETVENEEPSPLALFIVTFGIFAIILVLIKFMGYL
jgi:hypothetical protein